MASVAAMKKSILCTIATLVIITNSFLGEECMAQPKNADEDFVSFNVGNAGASASIEFHVDWLYCDQPREVYLLIKPFGEWQQPNSEMAKLIKSLSGREMFSAWQTTNEILPHKGIRIQVTWLNKKSGDVIKNSILYRDNLGVAHSSFNEMDIDYAVLPVGDYVVNLTAIDDDSRFNNQSQVFIALKGIGWFKK